jgi:Tfp pilus assembly protein PilP
MRLVQQDPNTSHSPEGPGFFSPLQDTISLDCFRFKSISGSGKNAVALLEDERGKFYRVKRGDFLGENRGRIIEITTIRISVSQRVRDANSNWIQAPRYLFREGTEI